VRRFIASTVLLGLLVAGAACGSNGAAESSAAPAGHGAHSARPGLSPKPLRAGERFVELSLPEPYPPAAPNGGTDEYRCFLVDPAVTESGFLTGSQFLPQNADIVHHAIFFRVEPDLVAEARRVDAESDGQGWTCFGDAGIPGDSAWVAHWAPGADETLLAADIGYPMPPGSQLVMQVHYNLLGSRGRPGAADQSGIRLRLTERRDLKPLDTMLLPAPVELACADGESGPLCDRAAAVRDVIGRFGDRSGGMIEQLNRLCNQGQEPVTGVEQRCDHFVRGPGTAYAVAGHMHLLGRSIKVQLNPSRPDGRTLLDVPSYNFDEQAVIPLPEPVALKAGDTLRVTCTHDVTLRQRLPHLRDQPPRYVVWGEGTSDEMCLGLVVWSPAS
jgi:Copper type II ascorbate-dependent monooxygenase, C-terminal domain